MDSQTLPTHSVLFLSLLIQTICAMGRCCSLSTRSTRRNPLPIAPTATALPYTYSTSYPMLAFIYNIYYCHHQHVSLLLLSLPLEQQTFEHSVYPLNCSCLYHVFTTGCLYIYIMYTYQMQDMYNTCCFPSLSATQPSPHLPLPISTRPTSSRWVPPYVPWFCLRFLPDSQGVFR